MARLTAKQEKFAQLVAAGSDLSTAYRKSYDCEKSSDQVIWNRASELNKHSEVSVRVKELRRQNENTAIWTRTEALERLKRIAEEARQATSEPILDGMNNVVGIRHNSQAAGVELKSIEQAAKMCGFNEPDKTDTTVKFNSIEEFLKVAGESEY